MKKLIVFLFLLMIAGCGGNKDDMVKGYIIGMGKGVEKGVLIYDEVLKEDNQTVWELMKDYTAGDWMLLELATGEKDKKFLSNMSSAIDKDLVKYKELLKDVHYEKEGV